MRLGPKPNRVEVDAKEEEDRLLFKGIKTPLRFWSVGSASIIRMAQSQRSPFEEDFVIRIERMVKSRLKKNKG